MTKRLAFLGPQGTFTEQAAFAYDSQASPLPYPSVDEAARAVEEGEADEAVVPIENSLQGSVTTTLDLLIHESSLYIRNELILPITHCLLSKAEVDLNEVKVVYSHPQALAQCGRFLRENLPNAELVASLSTAAGVEDMQPSDTPAAAIATERAATLYGASILARRIEDNPNNVTRFVVLAASDHDPTGADKTSLCWSHDEDVPGLLFSVLREFADRDLNLAKIESRPTGESLGKYYFLVDVEGHREDALVKEALNAVRSRASMLRILGSYPRHEASTV